MALEVLRTRMAHELHLGLSYSIANPQEEQTSTATHLEALRLRTAEHQEAATLARREVRRSKRCVKALEARRSAVWRLLDRETLKSLRSAHPHRSQRLPASASCLSKKRCLSMRECKRPSSDTCLSLVMIMPSRHAPPDKAVRTCLCETLQIPACELRTNLQCMAAG